MSPEDMAPEPDSSVDYKEEDDPEMLEESYSKESIQRHTQHLMEAGVNKTSLITSFLNSNSTDKSFAAFQNSEFGSEEINVGTYKAYTKDLVKKGKVNLSQEEFSQAVGGGGGKGPGPKKGQEFYEKPELAPNYKPSATLSKFADKYGDEEDFNSLGSADEQFDNMTDIVADIASGEATKRHALIYGDPGVGKTYECTRALQANIGRNPKRAQMLYFKGNIGKSLTSLVGFFYHYRNNYVIMLDDNDAMLMVGGVPQQIKLFFKAILDPDAIEQPIAVPTTVIKGVSNAISELKKTDDKKAEAAAGKKKGKREGVRITIDKDRLREGQLLIYANGKEVVDTRVPLDEALEFHGRLIEKVEEVETNRDKYFKPSWKRLYEREDEDPDIDDDWDELEEKGKKRRAADDDDDEVNVSDFMDGEEEEMPTEFIFNSSVIFISNLTKQEIDPAVWDRFTTAELSLTPTEYMSRLSKIYDKLGNVNPEISSVSQAYVDWAKKVVLVVMQGIMEAWQSSTPLMGVNIQIPKRTLTFRLFNEFVEFFLRTARSWTRRVGGGNLNDKAYRDKVTLNVEKALLKEAIRKICFS